jgi:pimeloyl-ACP methyl ester carboxylesterase/protein-tyrosine phosphatase
VFVHGLGGSLAQFHLLLTSFVNVGPCLGIDLPGCGRSKFSPTDWNAYSIEAITLLLEAVIEKHLSKEEGQGFILISHSMGCSLSALLASNTSPNPSKIRRNALGLVAICPRAEPPSQKEVKGYQKLLWIPNPIFNLYRMWDRRGGLQSTSVTRFVGKDGDEDTKRLQERYNGQSRTPVWRRMAWGTLPKYDGEGSPQGGFPGLSVWTGLEIPIFLIAGESDHVTKPEELQKIANAFVTKMREADHDQGQPPPKELPSNRPTTPKISDSPFLDQPTAPKVSDLPFLNNGPIKPFSEIDEFQETLAAHERNKEEIRGQILELDSSTAPGVNGDKVESRDHGGLKNKIRGQPQITEVDSLNQHSAEEIDVSTDNRHVEPNGLRNAVDQSERRNLEDDHEAAEATESAIHISNTHPNPEQELDSFPEASKPRRSLKTTILPPPASHAMLFDYATYRTLAGLIETFLAEKIDHRLSLGWQLQHLSTSGKWDVKNLAKWQKTTPVSQPIGGVFRAMKTLRGIDEIHTPKKFVEQWKGKIYAVIDISHDSPVYDPAELQNGGIEYHKFSTVSKIPPTKDEVKDFISLVERIRAKAPAPEDGKEAPMIGVHCHYGFNRTGFFVASYLIEKKGYKVNEAIDEFAEQRPPGIKHAHFINELSVRYTKGLKRSPTQ